jgi:hypothetical protein
MVDQYQISGVNTDEAEFGLNKHFKSNDGIRQIYSRPT